MTRWSGTIAGRWAMQREEGVVQADGEGEHRRFTLKKEG
jgi:hypothetical protein